TSVGDNASPGNNVDFSPYLDNGTNTNAANVIGFTPPLSVLDVVPEVGSGAPVVSPQVDSLTQPNNPIQEAYNDLPTAGGTIQIVAGTNNRNIDLTLNTLSNSSKVVPVTLDLGTPTAINLPAAITINGNVKISPQTTLKLTVSGSGPSDQ